MRRADFLAWALAVTALSASVTWVIRQNPGGLLRACPLRALTGIPCPACGTTQALRHLSAGRVTSAFASNPLVAAVAIVALASGVASIALLGWAERLHPPRLLSRRAVYWIAFILLAANWAYLIAASVL